MAWPGRGLRPLAVITDTDTSDRQMVSESAMPLSVTAEVRASIAKGGLETNAKHWGFDYLDKLAEADRGVTVRSRGSSRIPGPLPRMTWLWY